MYLVSLLHFFILSLYLPVTVVTVVTLRFGDLASAVKIRVCGDWYGRHFFSGVVTVPSPGRHAFGLQLRNVSHCGSLEGICANCADNVVGSQASTLVDLPL